MKNKVLLVLRLSYNCGLSGSSDTLQPVPLCYAFNKNFWKLFMTSFHLCTEDSTNGKVILFLSLRTSQLCVCTAAKCFCQRLALSAYNAMASSVSRSYAFYNSRVLFSSFPVFSNLVKNIMGLPQVFCDVSMYPYGFKFVT